MSPKFFLRRSLWLLMLSFFFVSCVPVPPSPEGSDAASVAATSAAAGETQNLYLPAVQNRDEPFPMPKDSPLAEWNTSAGWVPIMPGAQAGQEMSGKYVFTIPARIPDVENYYLQELEARGWEALSIAESPNKTVLLFQQGEIQVTVTMDFLVEQELCYVTFEE